ncbi:CocE/NonD family hydrolase [Blastopirellula sp. JC732]|uniref:CocE/NonD family hydrolase n=1 Tax=Blastopirellula sediminis TaxID=2894196 RepID=A0A9X1MSJ5_9BACT|nr:CocE/NonD family hydrolase [Blastopirellula sediminis]MCC9604990.1 CocE/NonD family hydrolase [Blastopirellula sediminis]MCC9631710.1 CocE/NonD family hydrolase [Blastopirellula sediminis]
MQKRTLGVALFAVVLCLASAGALVAQDYVVEKNVMVPMRDGIRLATDVYRPAVEGQSVAEKLPVILSRLPYNKDGQATAAKYFATHGYVFVAQDTRGRYKSEGTWHMLTDDGVDGVDCAAWIGKQPWSNGRIGMIGTSYFGGTQHAMALAGAPELKTVIPVDAMSNLGRQSLRNAGAFELRFWNWIFLNAGRGSNAALDEGTAAELKEMADERFYYLTHLPTRRGMTPLKLAPEYEDWLINAMEHGANDEFWAQNNIVDHPEQYKDIPVYLVSGWYDSWGGNNTANYIALSKTIKGPVYLIMGPWIHGAQSSYAHGQVTFGNEAAIADQWAWRQEWYDHWLKGIDNSVGKAAPFATPVRIFVMGTGDGSKDEKGCLVHGGYWRDEQEWPLARTKYTSFYLQPGGGLATKAATAPNSVTQFQFDPADPVPTIGGNISSGDDILVQGAWNQKGGPHIWNFQQPVPISSRRDVLVFQTEPLEEDLEVTGEIEVKLYASSSAVDTDFTAKLIDVYPPSTDWPGGFDLNLGDGIVRGRFRESLTKEKLMTPGEVYEFTIKLYPTSNVFKQGHRIRVDISSSNFPRFDVNPNTGEPLNRNRLTKVADQTIYHDPEHPSRIMLPVIPAAK